MDLLSCVSLMTETMICIQDVHQLYSVVEAMELIKQA